MSETELVVRPSPSPTNLALPTEPTQAEHPVTFYLLSISENSRKTMRRYLDRLARASGFSRAEEVPWPRWTAAQMAVMKAWLEKEDVSPATAQLYFAAVRGVLKACFILKQIPEGDYIRLAMVKPQKSQRLPRGRLVPMVEFEAIAKATGKGNKGRRDRAVLSLLYGAGLRIHEPSGLRLDSYTRSNGHLRVLGKGRKERIVPLPPWVQDRLERWLQVRGDEPGPLFYRVVIGGHFLKKRVSVKGTTKVIMDTAKRAGVKLSTHDFRRSFITNLFIKGHDISTIQRLAGHNKIETTALYDVRGLDQMAAATRTLDAPRFGDDDD